MSSDSVAPGCKGNPPTPTGGVYIHIPFCRSKCIYCDFYSVAGREDTMDRFVTCLTAEIAGRRTGTGLTAATAAPNWQVDTVYIGGGTPSLLEPRHLEAIVRTLGRSVGLSAVTEFTLEANPGEAPVEKLQAFRELGVNRLSLGMQSFQPALLRFLGRWHDLRDNIATFEAARKAGFENISADLIFNVPGQTQDLWRRDLAALVDMEPEHISAYSLTVEPGTPLHGMVRSREVTLSDEEVDRSMFALAGEYLEQGGYPPYEISNYAREGHACRHNLHYWRIEPYLGFGPSAHAFDSTRRSWNVRELDEYLQRIEAGRSPVAGSEVLRPEDSHNERLAFGLRLTEGVSVIGGLGYESVAAFTARFEPQLERWRGALDLYGERLRLTGDGWFLADLIAADFFILPG